MPPLWLHATPAFTGGCCGVPATHTSCVQVMLSTWTSRLFTAVVCWPLPLQTFVKQSPAVCDAIAVPFGTLLVMHTPALQVNVWQTLFMPQWLSIRHCTQTGDVAEPLQRVPPFSLQVALAGSDGFEGAPFMHRSIVQPLLSTGRSVGSLTDT